MNISDPLTLVVGGTGKTGRRVVGRLNAAGHRVRSTSRRADPPFDWGTPSTWRDAVRGVDAAYVTYYPDLALPGVADTIAEFAATAVASGVRKLVLLSGRGEPGAELSERAVQESGADWTILRCSWFAQNFSEHFLLDSVLDGVIALPAGATPEPFVDADDIADVAVAALTRGRHSSEVYELTGPQCLTFAEAAAEISAASGRTVAYVPVSSGEFAAAAAQAGMAAEEAGALADLFAEVLDGRNAHVSADVERVLGRAPRDFRHYALAAAASGVWNPSLKRVG